jgi:site-specific DNA recombinase
MGNFFAYARVSTPRQGEKGVSLPEQRSAIERYASVRGFEITRWFEERDTASKQGRLAFNEMLRLLRRRVAAGVIIHKIDRSARNLDDWADIEKLVDAGVDVHFATENVDLRTVAGRLTADIQAVVATHYSRNLREEVKKGLYGRLKQGFYPFRAPIGYLDQGSAKPKILDPATAPFVREAFNLYQSGEYSLPGLTREMFSRGLRNRGGTYFTMGALAKMLKNPFYFGIIRIVRTGQTFGGNHTPLVSTEVFENVQALLAGKKVNRIDQHVFQFSRMVRCASCGYSLIAERKKGHVYYRCHNRPFKNPAVCPPTSIREEQLDHVIASTLADVDLQEKEIALAKQVLESQKVNHEAANAEVLRSLQLQLDQIENRLARLTDLLLDRAVDTDVFNEKHEALLTERARVRERLVDARRGSAHSIEQATRTVELAKSPSTLYKLASPQKKRELAKTLLSNLSVSGKNVDVTLALPFRLIADRQTVSNGGACRGSCRTWENTLQQLIQYFTSFKKTSSDAGC